VCTHAQRRVDEHGSVSFQRGRQQLDAAVEKNRGVDVAQVHDVGAFLVSLGPDPHPL